MSFPVSGSGLQLGLMLILRFLGDIPDLTPNTPQWILISNQMDSNTSSLEWNGRAPKEMGVHLVGFSAI